MDQPTHSEHTLVFTGDPETSFAAADFAADLACRSVAR
jgi:hypothetical protein